MATCTLSSSDSFPKEATCPFSFPPPSPGASSFLKMVTCPFPSFISTSVILVKKEKLKITWTEIQCFWNTNKKN